MVRASRPRPATSQTDTGGLYARLAGEYGRCTSKVYLDTKSRGTIAIGWVFQKKVEYDDAYRYDDKSKREYLRDAVPHQTCANNGDTRFDHSQPAV